MQHGKDLITTWLALGMEEGEHKSRNEVTSKIWKNKEMNSPLESPDRNIALPTR